MVKLLISFGKFLLTVKIDCRIILALLMYFSQ